MLAEVAHLVWSDVSNFERLTHFLFPVRVFHALRFPSVSGVEMKIYKRSSHLALRFLPRPSHLRLLLHAALASLLATPPNGELFLHAHKL